jgi:hypothetical protein
MQAKKTFWGDFISKFQIHENSGGSMYKLWGQLTPQLFGKTS